MLVELFSLSVMMQYAELCGWTLARTRACSNQGGDKGMRRPHFTLRSEISGLVK